MTKIQKILKYSSFLLIIITSLLIYQKNYNKYLKIDNKKKLPDIIKKDEKKKDEHYEATLIAVGDNLIHSSVYKDAIHHSKTSCFTFVVNIPSIQGLHFILHFLCIQIQ